MTTRNGLPPETSPRRFKPYPAYKDSGIEWLGEIPAQWGVGALKRLVRIEGGGTPSKDQGEFWSGDIPWVSPKDMKSRLILDTLDRITEEGVKQSATHFIPEGAVLIVVRSGILNHSIPVAIAGRRLTVNQDLKALIPGMKLAPAYLMWIVEGHQRAFLVEWRKEGATVESLELDLLRSTRLPLPDPDEQRAIAAFLDWETARIDALVAKKERLIELLQEKRTALITRAVTKGLDPDVPMKDSGVEWLGKIPAHWQVKKLKQIVPQITVGIVVTPSKYYVDQGVPCLRALNIAQGHIDTAELVFISPTANELHRKSQIFKGDLIVVRTGRAGTAVIVPREYSGANCIDLLIIRRSEQLQTRFLYYFVNSHSTSAQVGAYSVGAIQEHYNTGTLANLYVPKVPLQEQEAIAGFLDQETARVDALATKVRGAIDCLKELRSALISAAVTGKIDVRAAVTPAEAGVQ
jgi:type I restriction enzyme S subunit